MFVILLISYYDSLNVRYIGGWPYSVPQAVLYDTTQNVIFLGSGCGVYVLDASDPFNPLEISCEIKTRGIVRGLYYDATNGNLYIATFTHGMEIWDVNDFSNPVKLGSISLPGAALGVWVNGGHAYIASIDYRLIVVDVSEPSAPSIVHADPVGSFYYTRDIAGKDTLLYLLKINSLEIVDVSDPSSPESVSVLNTGGKGMYMDGNYIYIAGGYSGLGVVDISDPSSPFLAGSCSINGDAWDVWVSGNYAYVAVFDSGVCVIDISDPSSPRCTSHVYTPGTHYYYFLSGTGNCLYTASPPGYPFFYTSPAEMKIIDVQDPSSPVDTGSFITPSYFMDIKVSGDLLYAANTQSGLRIFDTSDPSSPQVLGVFDTPSSVTGLDVHEPYVYLADDAGGLRIVDVSDPTNPVEAGSLSLPGYARDVEVVDSFAYVVQEWTDTGFCVVNVKNPSSPQFISGLAVGSATGLKVSGNCAFVAAGGKLMVVDISDPFNPVKAGSLAINAYDVDVSENHAFVAGAWDTNFFVVDISEPANPSLLSTFHLPDVPFRVVVDSIYAYLSCGDVYGYGDGEIRVIDVSDPANPQMVGYASIPDDGVGMDVAGNLIFVASYSGGIQVYENMLINGIKRNANPLNHTSIQAGKLVVEYSHPGILAIYDVAGRKIRKMRLCEEKGRVEFSLPSGVYFITLEGKGVKETEKVVVIK